MKLKRLWVNGFKNLKDFEINFESNEGITLLIGNNGSGKSNILEAISAIFVSLIEKKKVDFEYEIEYILDVNEVDKNFYIELKIITLQNGNSEYTYSFKIDDLAKQKNQFLGNYNYLPSHIITSYSGEETRLWDLYYEKFYKDYIKKAITPTDRANHLKMIYVNKYHWKIAFLLLAVYDRGDNSFIKNILKIDSVESIGFKFNIAKFPSFRNQAGELLRLARSLTPNNLPNVNYTNLDDIKTIFQNFGHERDLFLLLVGAFLPARDTNKLILDIDIKFKKLNVLLDVNCLSEGEKKLILVKMILEYLSFEKALVLLDEPDSHIHIQNKKVFKELVSSYENRFSILTTHSPTLTHSFDDKHISMLNNGKIEDKQKQEIFSHITDGIWNYQEQSVFLSSTKNIILLVEGKHDKIHIEEAFKRLKSNYQTLNFEIFSTDGATNLKQLVVGFATSDYDFEHKKVIAIFDDDQEGKKGLSRENFEPIAQNNLINKLKSNNKFYGFLLPKQSGFTSECTIENMYTSDKYQMALNQVLERRMQTPTFFNNKSIDNISKAIKDDAKNQLANNCKEFVPEDFEHFKELFNLIKEIEDLPL
ncbi:hypothetical protein Abu_1715 [Aliarcobacter butzleri RM4018]|uniref:Uncharacterized protein n=1 Tax=Aliarcobacter butzleri (strain RM4018) TaxID=367737 RepID=A8EVI9_ALIB4|nr:ATP-binding protein [Aliarcobacter butzleri]ABV67962.1 hypothetical protein Abu_1715 [Aliarcobacter butzleri RM4018]GGT78733.1 hypothetical protein GCM10007985_13990 [Aliarcobacter butzleri]SNV31365.1 recombination protein F [Aliarcobacter butzleri]